MKTADRIFWKIVAAMRGGRFGKRMSSAFTGNNIHHYKDS
jgi:hypothetical protein